jgi:hypothetical protein
MLLAVVLAASLAAQPPVGDPPPPALTRVNCFNTPLFFEPGASELAAEDKSNFEAALAWLARPLVRREVRVVLRMNTRENPYDNPTVPLLFSRPEDMRRLLISKGIPHDRILIADEMWGDRSIERTWDVKDFKGAWIQPEFYLTLATLDRLGAEVAEPGRPNDGDPCFIPRPASAPASPPSPPAGPSAPEPAATRPRER